ncbi:bifunctional 4-hydroxy-2-oxoglutarate aldolase/2-dehydro-3-deoxy-phosphogluconate aldolase [Kibdelosporangium philippinense]|uniref:Bifunctional 4-hydroxy-2-oxoglutarate aldolase/2-dehydro-3-deoxy-phosphogluconate aldolase n=1 Tax=Kibdelosporangium philippinense TaxID=211113 RepID=A0ABS8Z5D1_9PSEU|nr:bifunctional 4-hydroxy-2-oxoglutarate aldolase/2-dehydro-3-deoxy-phosphogluconate aldolase [Kibdelosporangium philippinense]MCE7001841.1 bifunctional 4-hydroxy-2-oxoglutarate aldolase/2-dehydro-3-deoxy-phosphogluconate aldolase [Kibdelosporangium philippinense]
MDLIAELKAWHSLCIIRAPQIADPAGLGKTLVESGLPIVEFSFTTPNAPKLMEQAAKVDGLILGAGTVMTEQDARDAINAGAKFLLTPGLRPKVAAEAVRQGVPIVLGAMTPTEVADALDMGATAVKVFPAARLGPAYFKDLHGPYPGIPLVATGGLNAANAAEYLEAGALAVTAGSGVVSPALAADSRLAEIAARAREFVDAVATARVTEN